MILAIPAVFPITCLGEMPEDGALSPRMTRLQLAALTSARRPALHLSNPQQSVRLSRPYPS
jgi:hypothetical protein